MFHLTVLRSVLMSMVLVLTGLAQSASAHEIRPAIADVSVGADRVDLTLVMTLESLLSGIDLSQVTDTNEAPEAAEYDALRSLPPIELETRLRAAWDQLAPEFIIDSDGTRSIAEIVEVTIPEIGNPELPRDSTLVLRADLPVGTGPVQIGWAPRLGDLVLRQVEGGAEAYEGFLGSGDLSEPLPRADVLNESAFAVFLRYIVVGFEHIIPLGIDHILFVLGLFFFSLHLRPMLFQVTAFTLAHTITLALASLEIVRVPASIVEPLIAASIVYVGVENVIGRSNLKARTALVFAFGLLHGLGFASVLGDFGIDTSRFAAALVGFNIGVELGQLAVITLAFLAVGLWFGKKHYYRNFIAIPASLAIAAVGAFWTFERVFL